MYKTTLFFLLFSIFGYSQNIQFADADLLLYLTTRPCVDTNGDGVFDSDADFNNDGQIQMSEALQVTSFSFTSSAHDIQSLGGFQHFNNLQHLNVTTINVSHLDFSVWPNLKTLKLSSSISSFVFNNPLLTRFELQNVAFTNPLFDFTNLPSLEFVNIQSSQLNDNLIFGTHNNLEELRISGGTFSTLNLSGMPALKRLLVHNFVGPNINISNCLLLEEFDFSCSLNCSSIIGHNASSNLKKIKISAGDENYVSNLNLAFDNKPLRDIEILGANTFSLTNNTVGLGDVELRHIAASVLISNSDFAYIDAYLDSRLLISQCNASTLNLTDLNGLRFLLLGSFPNLNDLDLSTVKAEFLNIDTMNLDTMNLKNGQVQMVYAYDVNAGFICVDREEATAVADGFANSNIQPVIHPYCSFVLGGDYHEITGAIHMNLGNGCATIADRPVFDLQFTVSDGVHTDTFYGGTANTYSTTVPEGSHLLTAAVVNSDLWTVTPSAVALNFPADGSIYNQNFCITPAGAFNDLEISIIPISDARPGFTADYKVVYKNVGTTTLSGAISFDFDDNVLNFVTASPNANSATAGNLSWNYSNLLSFETREISLSLLLNTPTHPTFPLNSTDVLHYTATITPVTADETADNNVFTLHQAIVNAFDPNDITCLQGNTITQEQVGDYVHYRIRFENNGTANAVSIVVKNTIDLTKFDLSSIVPITASHNFYTRIANGNELEFIFEDIQLPFDDANNDGYVVYKIKTVPTLVQGSTFSNQAAIYFDFNFPIVTNNELTTVSNALSVPNFDSVGVSLFPNPVQRHLTVRAGAAVDAITIYDLNGRLLASIEPKFNSQEHEVDVQHLASGVYFLEVRSTDARQTVKFIKN